MRLTYRFFETWRHDARSGAGREADIIDGPQFGRAGTDSRANNGQGEQSFPHDSPLFYFMFVSFSFFTIKDCTPSCSASLNFASYNFNKCSIQQFLVGAVTLDPSRNRSVHSARSPTKVEAQVCSEIRGKGGGRTEAMTRPRDRMPAPRRRYR